jgi:hypothetical protein
VAPQHNQHGTASAWFSNDKKKIQTVVNQAQADNTSHKLPMISNASRHVQAFTTLHELPGCTELLIQLLLSGSPHRLTPMIHAQDHDGVGVHSHR